MSEGRKALIIQRILVALDASPHSLAALDAAIDLATRFRAELSGLFVEDENLLRLSGLNFVSEIGLFSATRRRVDSEEIERQMRLQSRRVQRIFTLNTERAQLRGTFHVTRGVVLSEVLAAAAEADMLVLGRLGWSLMQRHQLGSTVRGVLPSRFGLVLIMKKDACLDEPLAVVYDGSPAAGRALEVAAALRHQPDDAALLVLLLTEDESAETLQVQAATRLSELGVLAHFRALTRANILRLAFMLQEEACGALVLPARSPTLQNDTLVKLLERVELPALLVT